MEILEIKNKILQIKTSMDGLKNRMMMTEARVSKPEDVNQSKEEEKVLKKKKKIRASETWVTITKNLMHITGVPKKKEERIGAKKYNG